MSKVAAIDLGTNTFLCLIAEVEGQKLRVVEDLARVVRLGEKVHQNKRFLPEALDRAALCLDEFERVIKEHGVKQVIATATSAARDAANGSELLDLGRKRNIPILIIDGKKEAQLSFDGAVSAINDASKMNILVIDVGGGSTELIFRKSDESEIKARSFNVGCVRLTEMFLKKDPVDETEYKKMMAYGAKILTEYGVVNPDIVIAVAGTPTTLAAVAQGIEFDEERVEGFVLTRSKIEKMIKELGALPLPERKKTKGIEPLRADVIVAGGALLLCGLNVANKSELRVSTRGLRYGLALHHKEFM